MNRTTQVKRWLPSGCRTSPGWVIFSVPGFTCWSARWRIVPACSHPPPFRGIAGRSCERMPAERNSAAFPWSEPGKWRQSGAPVSI